MKTNLSIKFLSLALITLLNACAAIPSATPTTERQTKVQKISTNLNALSPTIDPLEAQTIANTVVYYPLQLAKEYKLTKPPLIHNVLVNSGAKPRGLCIHWAEDILKELQKKNLKTVNLYWAVANKGNLAREHSSVVVTAKNHDFNSGLVFDGWRHSGILYWTPVKKDPKYKWFSHIKKL